MHYVMKWNKILKTITTLFFLLAVVKINAQYCGGVNPSYAGPSYASMYISKVEIKDATTNTVRLTKTTTSLLSTTGYADYTSTSGSLAIGSVNTITIQLAYSTSGNARQVAAWIDYNNDGIFTEPAEKIYGESIVSGANGQPVLANFTVPSSAIVGARRMRVRVTFNSDPILPCGQNSYIGEVQDYTINVTGGASCTLAPIVSCPATITVTAASGATTATASFMTATASSPCSGATTNIAYIVNNTVVTSSYAFPVGSTVVTARATHSANTQNTDCTFTVTVNPFTAGGGGGQWSGNANTTDNIYRLGRVAIGTTNFGTDNTYGLLVKGAIRTEKVKVELSTTGGWADYVFEPTYKLNALKNVEAFVKKYKHLPNMPSEKEMAEDNSIDLGLTMKKQQEKIEELFLYIIDLDKKMKEQQAEIVRLKKNK
jgi:hypothetical protein